MTQDQTPASPWRRLKKNKAAFGGLLLIALSALVAVMAYYVAPDHSPNANRMLPEVANKPPGFGIRILQLKKEGGGQAPVAFFRRLLEGEPATYQLLPLNGYHIQGDSIVIEKYIDEGLSERQAYALQQTAPVPVKMLRFTLGTDRFGRDLLSRLIIGTRVSLGVGAIAVLLSLTIGILLGAIAGYYRGWVDDAVMWVINVIWSIPTLLLVFAITLVLGKGFWQVFIAVGLTMWVNVARLVRGQVLQVREMQYIEATRVLGYSSFRTIVYHILPNILGPVIVIAASNFASAIVIEAGLSFLGVGVQPPQPSWGLMIKENYNFIITHQPMLALAPGMAIMVLVLAFNLLGNGLRDALQVRTKV